MKKLCLIIFLLMPWSLLANIQIAIIDTGFCPGKIKTKKNIVIEKVIDLTSSLDQSYCEKFDESLPRFHGHLVLKSLIDFLEIPKDKIFITPLVIFDRKALQNKRYWSKIIDKKFNLVISATGLVTDEKIARPMTSNWFVATPRIGGGIHKRTEVYPANIANQKNIFLVGDYLGDIHDSTKILFDEAQLYQSKIDYFFSSGNAGELRGTSKAVTEAAARAINFCRKELHNNLRSCLKKISFDVNGMKSF
jgi:hypothetical protein